MFSNLCFGYCNHQLFFVCWLPSGTFKLNLYQYTNSWMWLFVFYLALIFLGNTWIHLLDKEKTEIFNFSMIIDLREGKLGSSQLYSTKKLTLCRRGVCLFQLWPYLFHTIYFDAKLNCLKWNCFWYWNTIYTKLNCLIWNCFDI